MMVEDLIKENVCVICSKDDCDGKVNKARLEKLFMVLDAPPPRLNFLGDVVIISGSKND